MTTSFRSPLDRVCEQLHQHLRRALTEHSPNEYKDALSLETVDPPGAGESQTAFRIEGPNGVSFRVELEILPIGRETCDVHVATEEGPPRHFTCDRPGEEEDRPPVGRAAHLLAIFLLSEIERRRGHVSSRPPDPSELPPHVPLLVLDEEGTIEALTEGARRILNDSSDGSLEPNFFTHVHGQNLQRVMQDLARMVAHRKQNARWLLRLRTGAQRWRWYRAVVENHLDRPDGGVRVLLRPLSDQ
jgi:hypothetical protein